MGYTPAFDSIYTGTLFGKWPTAAVWASLLPLIDSRGVIEMTHEAIAGTTGWPIDLLRAGIAELEKPDPGSRSQAEEGRRLIRLDPSRSWGWRAVNIQKYRDKASGQDQIADGRNAEKVRRYKERHRQTPEDTGGHRQTPKTLPDTHSDSNTDSDSNQEKKPSLRSGRAPARARSRRCPPDFAITAELRSWAREACPHVDIDRETESFRDHEFRNAHSDWVAVWRQWMRRVPEFRRNGTTAKSDSAVTWRPGPDD